MLVMLKKKSQLTIPSVLVKKLGLREGDVFDCLEEDGKIVLVLLDTVPKVGISESGNEYEKKKWAEITNLLLWKAVDGDGWKACRWAEPESAGAVGVSCL